MGRNGGAPSTSLAPGFRFHPTDEELVAYYLRRKVSRKPFRVDAISEVEVYKAEPWDLPGLSKLKTRDLEWYFFSNLDRKYSNGAKTNRATSEGYWKTTGKDRPVRHRSQVLGMKKTLVYHRGRAPRGERTNWVMHEYRLVDEQLEKAGVLLESFVLCRIFQKSGTGPKNGERYGAPFVDEEWEAEEGKSTSLADEPVADEVFITDELFAEGNDHDQKLTTSDLPYEGPYSPLNLYQGDGSSFLEDLATNELDLEPLPIVNEDQLGLETNDDKKFFNLPVQHELGAVKNEYAVPPANVMSHIPNNSVPGEQCLDSVNLPPSDDRFYLEANDLSEPIEGNPSELRLLDEYLAYFDAENDIAQYLTFDQPDLLDANDNLSDQTFLPDQNAEQASTSNQQLPTPDAYGAGSESSSKQVMEAEKSEPDVRYPFMKKESQMLGCFLAPPPAFASNFPKKDVAAKHHAALHSSESVRVTAGMIRIRDSMNDNGIHWSLDKRGNVNVVLTFDLPDGIIVNTAGIKAFTGMLSQKMTSVISHDWAYLFFSVMLLFVSAKVGACIYAR